MATRQTLNMMRQLLETQERIKGEANRLADTLQSALLLAQQVRANVDTPVVAERVDVENGKGRLSHPPVKSVVLKANGVILLKAAYELAPDTGELTLLIARPLEVLANYTHVGLATELVQLSTVVSDVTDIAPAQLLANEAKYGAALEWIRKNLA
jgi:hypothetical protein